MNSSNSEEFSATTDLPSLNNSSNSTRNTSKDDLCNTIQTSSNENLQINIHPEKKHEPYLKTNKCMKKWQQHPITISQVLTEAEEVDEILDHSIEVDSNRRMREANVNPWTLRFNDQDTEIMVKVFSWRNRKKNYNTL